MKNPRTYADFPQSPRYPEVIRTRTHSGETCTPGAVLRPHSSALGTQVPTELSRNSVAGSDKTESQAWLATLGLGLLFAACFLGPLLLAGAFE